jgi:acetoin utilization deacetylase AcuC-like enzyme
MTTGYIWHELFGWHDTGTGSLFEADALAGMQPISHGIPHPDTKRRLHELVAVSGLLPRLKRLDPVRVTEDQILAVHTQEHLDDMKRQSAQPRGGDAGDGGSPFGKGGFEIASLSAGGALVMLDSVLSGAIDNGYAVINPPGHHALPDKGMGMCMFNNIAIAIRNAQKVHGVERVAVVDWDVHHGNGTQGIFYEDPSVFTISMHQDGCFPPDSGHLHEQGAGDGEGFALNIPLPPGTGDEGHIYAMENAVIPALKTFKPDVIIVASGLDANGLDPLARQLVTSRAFRRMTELVLEAADELCDGRLVMMQEGGYSPHYVPWCGLAIIETLAGADPLPDGMLKIVAGMGGHDLQPHQKSVVDAAAQIKIGPRK